MWEKKSTIGDGHPDSKFANELGALHKYEIYMQHVQSCKRSLALLDEQQVLNTEDSLMLTVHFVSVFKITVAHTHSRMSTSLTEA